MELTTAQIIEGNKLISKSIFAEKDIIDWVEDIKNPSDKFCLNVIKYHSDWNMLMSVVEKIENLGYKTVLSMSDFTSYKYYMNIITGVGIVNESVNNPSKFMCQSNSKIEAVYLVVIEFIKWYNTQAK